MSLNVSNLNFNVFHLYVIQTNNRNSLKKFLEKKNIDTQIFYKKILPFTRAYKKYKFENKNFPNSLKTSKTNLCLPIGPEIDQKKIKYISHIINKFFNKI